MLAPLVPQFASTRSALQTVAVHVMARRRHEVCGRFGLRPGPASLVTPQSGPAEEVIVASRSGLAVASREAGALRVRSIGWAEASLDRLAEFVGVDLDQPFSVGSDTPPVGDRGRLGIDPDAVDAVVDWYTFGHRVLDRVLAAHRDLGPTLPQVWPEHFDLGCDVAGGSSRVNLGASPGDGFADEPYLYVGPWGAERPGEGYWNAPFGAALTHRDLLEAPDPVEAGVRFMVEGLARLAT